MIDEELIISIISDSLGLEVSKEDSFDALGLDSLDMLDLILECEHTFNVSIDSEEIMKLHTIKDLVNLIQVLNMQDYFESTQADLQPDYD